MRARAGVTAGLLAAALTAGLLGAPPSLGTSDRVVVGDRAAPGRDEPYTFVSSPDLTNGDVGDLRSAPTWRKGMPNSWNQHWAANIANIFGQLADQDADDYLVAGDLVEGQWQLDKTGDEVFGTGDATVNRAGNAYYGQWTSFWEQAGVDASRVHVAVGDHEVGDNLARARTLQYRVFDRFKKVFAQNFTAPRGTPRYPMHPREGQHERTAYATWLAPGVLLVTVDVFVRRPDGIEATVDNAQLDWVRRVLARTSPSDTVIVQGHVPVLGPVRTFATSALQLEHGQRSAFWQALRRYDVDLYLSGEVHADTAVQRAPGEPLQVSHGGLAKYGTIRFLTGTVDPDGTVHLVSRQIKRETVEPTGPRGQRLWSTNKTMPWSVVLDPFSTQTGRLTLSPDGTVSGARGHLRLNPEVPRD